MTFRDWLAGQMEAKDVSRRELARRLASQRPGGVTPQAFDTHRRAIRRYLDVNDPHHIRHPEYATRAAFADAFGVDPSEVPDCDDDEDEDLDATLAALVREQNELSRRIGRALRQKAVV